MLGVNITNTLAGFFNSGGQDLPKDPFLFSLKIMKNNKLWRFGANFKVDNSEQRDINGGFRIVKENEFLARLGREWRQPVSKSFSLFYGMDAVGSVFNETNSFEIFGGDLGAKEYRYGGGGGPFLGINFQLSDRVSFSTETYAYAIFYVGEKVTQIGQGLPDEKEEITRFTLLPAIPNSLYVHFSF